VAREKFDRPTSRLRHSQKEQAMSPAGEQAPFPVGDELEYLVRHPIEGHNTYVKEILLQPGMRGIVEESQPGGCGRQAQSLIRFHNGYRYRIFSHGKDRFRKV
jgi:hypothetical protein